MQGATGFGLELAMGQVLVQRHIVQRRQQDAAHRRAVRRQAATYRQVHRDQALGGGRAGDIEDIVAFEGGHVARFVQLLTHTVQIRLGRHRQRRRRQIGVAQGQHFGQQGVGPTISGRVAKLDQGVQTPAHRCPWNFSAMADLSDGQMPLALLKRLHHCQTSGQ